MSDVRRKYDQDFKKNAVKLSYASSKFVAKAICDLGISDEVLYCWRQKYTAEGDKTRFAALEEKNIALRLKNAGQAIEIDILKKPVPALQSSTTDLCIQAYTGMTGDNTWSESFYPQEGAGASNRPIPH